MLIEELYTFLKQADAARAQSSISRSRCSASLRLPVKVQAVQKQIDNFETHVVRIIADIDAGFGNEEATYLLANKKVQVGACCIEIENQYRTRNNVVTKTVK